MLYIVQYAFLTVIFFLPSFPIAFTKMMGLVSSSETVPAANNTTDNCITALIGQRPTLRFFYKPYRLIRSVPERTQFVVHSGLTQKRTTLYDLCLEYFSINAEIDQSFVIIHNVNYLGQNINRIYIYIYANCRKFRTIANNELYKTKI